MFQKNLAETKEGSDQGKYKILCTHALHMYVHVSEDLYVNCSNSTNKSQPISTKGYQKMLKNFYFSKEICQISILNYHIQDIPLTKCQFPKMFNARKSPTFVLLMPQGEMVVNSNSVLTTIHSFMKLPSQHNLFQRPHYSSLKFLDGQA
jgi:hypothetical protein